MNERSALSHSERMNTAIRYIDEHLCEELSLAQIAEEAAYSKFHFHRIFHSRMKETLSGYIQRRRLEKSAFFLRTDVSRSITEIALDCGFSSSAIFAKNFKNHFGMTATQWRKDGTIFKTKIQNEGIFDTWLKTHNPSIHTVKVENMSEMTIAYISYTGPYKGNATLFMKLFGKLYAWLRCRALIDNTASSVVLYHDYPDITPEETVSLSACIQVPHGTKGEGEIGVRTFAPGLCAIGRFECLPQEYQHAWDWMYDEWLRQSGFIPADIPAFESYPPHAYDKKTGKTTVDICIPLMTRTIRNHT